MNFGSKSGLTLASGLIALLLLGAPAVLAETLHDLTGRITDLCLSRELGDDACRCLSRETGSRFEPDQLAIIAGAMEAGETASDISAALLEQGMAEAEVASFSHRLDSAHIVIQQTCGASFFMGDGD